MKRIRKLKRKKDGNYCNCGCGQEVKLRNRYIHGHHNYNKNFSEETKQKMSIAKQNMSEETKQKISIAKQNMSEETKQKMSIAKTGKKFSEEAKQKISIIHTGKKLSEETKQKMSIANTGCKHPNWRGGKSLMPYCQEFTKDLKDFIKERDGNKCMNPTCDKVNDLCIHHINYDKLFCTPENLITLCRGCNTKANFNRDDHKEMYKTIIKQNYVY